MRYATCNRPTTALDSLILGPSAALILAVDLALGGSKAQYEAPEIAQNLRTCCFRFQVWTISAQHHCISACLLTNQQNELVY
jgi:hypothetical protein